MSFAALMIPEMSTGSMTYAAVLNMDAPLVAVVCRQDRNPSAAEVWEPLFLIKMGEDQPQPLPSCFSLRDEALDALDNLTQEETA